MINLRDIDLNLLVVFQELFRERRVSPAAERLQLSQSALSNALTRLRRTFGDDLFVRTPLGMQPTPLAQQISASVFSALNQVTKALNYHERFNPTASKRHFVIAMRDVGEVHMIPILVQVCARLAPHVQIATSRFDKAELKTEMEAGRIDLAVGAYHDMPNGFHRRRLFKQDHVTMFRKGHVLGRIKVTLRDFLSAQHLFVSASGYPYEKVNQRLQRAGVQARAAFTVSHFTAVPYIISSTNLVVTVPQKFAEGSAALLGLQFIRPPILLPSMQTNIFWHHRFNHDEGNQWLRGLIFDLFAEPVRPFEKRELKARKTVQERSQVTILSANQP
jgi:DNA-binding transcriptional LysR family regulator